MKASAGCYEVQSSTLFLQDLARARLRAEKYTDGLFLRIGHEAI
ncbi:hypothetical protein P368_06530 [Comamonas thiooxydans]|nr:hypothetical protein P365_10965 [Comamonas thiooxydans]KGH14304.1 hypothetical protein P368_06530 [Comamonas thiooxydans]